MSEDDSPDVIGYGGPVPTPTEEEFKAAFRAAYIARFVQRGLAEEDGALSFDAVEFSDLRDMTPEDAADEELSYWTDDGDIA